MTVVDLHPEELLDRESRGALSATDRAKLDAHLASCAACRFERASRLDFAAELDEPAPRLSGSVTRALAKVSASLPPPADGITPSEEPHVPSGAHAKRPRRAAMMLLVAAAILVVGVAGAAGVSRVLETINPAPTAPIPTVAATAIEAPKPKNVGKRSSHSETADEVATEPTSDAVETPTPAATTETTPAPAVTSSLAPSSVSTTTTRIELPKEHASAPLAAPTTLVSPEKTAANAIATATSSEAPAAPPVAPAPSAAAPPSTASKVFADANDARRRGDLDRALALYRDIETRFPDSDEAKIARANEGRILLDRGEAKGALDEFDHYLDHAGPLGEEAMAGRARSLGKLGRASEEADAWRGLLRAFPNSAYAGEARGRLAALSGSTTAR